MLKFNFDESWEYRHNAEEVAMAKEKFEAMMADLMRKLSTNRYAKVTFYPYRTARVYDALFDADRNSIRELEYFLAVKSGVQPDNHTTYEVYDGCQKIYIWCHDNLFRVGKTIEKGSW